MKASQNSDADGEYTVAEIQKSNAEWPKQWGMRKATVLSALKMALAATPALLNDCVLA